MLILQFYSQRGLQASVLEVSHRVRPTAPFVQLQIQLVVPVTLHFYIYFYLFCIFVSSQPECRRLRVWRWVESQNVHVLELSS